MTGRNDDWKGGRRSRPGVRQQWIRPIVRRLSAGSAEDGSNAIVDGGQPS